MSLGRTSIVVRLCGAITLFAVYVTAGILVFDEAPPPSPPQGVTIAYPNVEPAPDVQPNVQPVQLRAPVDGGANVLVEIAGEKVHLPILKTDYNVDVRGDLVAVEVTQRFVNPTDAPLEALYQFPLHEDAAVHAVTMRVGDEVVRAVIQQRDQAKKAYQEAVAQGRVATLSAQHRPNIFTQRVGNLMPGMQVEIELSYVMPAERQDGHYSVVLPLVVGPRFSPGTEEEPLPPSSPTHTAESLDPARVGIAVRIDAGLPLTTVESPTHPVEVARLGKSDARVELATSRTLDNRDFELRYAMSGKHTQAGLLAEYDPEAKRGWFSLLIEPPANPGTQPIVAREMVFVLDCSGSMRGRPMAASKAFIRRALGDLRPSDTFRIVQFSNQATEYANEPVAATARNVEVALAYVDAITSGGGTHMRVGVDQAFDPQLRPGTLRLVTFLTDGFIGNDVEVVKLLRSKIGNARVFAIGVGTKTNRYLIEELAHSGRGFARYIDPTAGDETVAAELAERLATPVFTDIQLVAPDAGLADVTPTRIRDLFAGESVRVMGTYTRPGPQTITVVGKVAGKAVLLPLEVNLPAESTDGDAVRLMWARARIADLMHTRATPVDFRERVITDDEIEREVTALGEHHSLVTRWTSFVGAADNIANPSMIPNVVGNVPVPRGFGLHGVAANNTGIGLGSIGLGGGGYGRGVSGHAKGSGNLGARSARVPKVVPGRPATQGSLDKEVIRRVVRQHRREVKYCYENELQRDPGLNGRVTVRFTISAMGSVVSAIVKESTLSDQSVERCMLAKMRRWVFPEPKGGGIVIVTYPFHFSS